MITLSQAVDEINHDVMMNKLFKSSIKKIMVRTIGYMLNIFADVRFNNGKGEK